jgi:hypothetical protein
VTRAAAVVQGLYTQGFRSEATQEIALGDTCLKESYTCTYLFEWGDCFRGISRTYKT